MKKKNSLSQVFVIWIFLILVIFVLFMANLSKIKATMETTAFMEKVFNKQESEKSDDDAPQKIQDEISRGAVQFETDESHAQADGAAGEGAADLTLVTTDVEPILYSSGEEEDEGDYETPVNTERLPADAATQNAKLYFVTIESDGHVVRREVNRQILQTQAPLSGSIKSLLKGPDLSDVSKNCISLIPAKSELLSAYIQDGTAYLNFNEAFQFNSYGAEGYQGQLMQVVFTATEFPSINSVQILIDGQKISYLGNDGAWVGSPLTRGSFAK